MARNADDARNTATGVLRKVEALFFTVCPHQDRRETAKAWHTCPRCVAEFAASTIARAEGSR